MRSKKGFSLVVLVFSFMTLFALAAFVVDFAIISNQRSELQKAVEMTALSVASSITLTENGGIYEYPSEAETVTLIDSTFNMVKDPNLLEFAKIDTGQTVVNRTSKAVKVYATMPARTYFAHVLGLGVVNLNAQAGAIMMPIYLTKSGADVDFHLQPAIGGMNYADNKENLYGADDRSIVSFGPGGYVTLDLDEMIVDAKGPDLLVRETGHKDGYFLFAGIEDKDGGDTNWVNISCTGIPVGANYTNSEVGAYSVEVAFAGGTSNQTKFYGSGLFDLGEVCSPTDGYLGQMKYANKIRIIDDNQEDGFLQENYSPLETPFHTLLLGDHSSVTPGADIDSVEVLNHAKLIPAKEVTTDSDSDGLIDYVENIIGTSNSLADTDGDGNTDEEEYNGWGYSAASGIIYFTSPTTDDNLGFNL